jgi:hypothetical protein
MKCTVLYGDNYHFYYDYTDDKYHLDFQKDGFNKFLEKAGNILEACPKSDSGIYVISMTKGIENSVIKNKCCCKF